jgi:hypothetical protein
MKTTVFALAALAALTAAAPAAAITRNDLPTETRNLIAAPEAGGAERKSAEARDRSAEAQRLHYTGSYRQEFAPRQGAPGGQAREAN